MARECGAEELHVSADWSAYARQRERRLRRPARRSGSSSRPTPGRRSSRPGAVTPTGGDHFKVFTPYHRAWSAAAVAAARRRAAQAHGADASSPPGELPALAKLTAASLPPHRAPGGETEGAQADAGLPPRRPRPLRRAATTTSPATAPRGSAPTCASAASRPLELLREAQRARGGEPFVRQLCWRDFHHQVLAATPSLPRRDYRPRGDRWSRSERAFEAWREGRTGYPLVDAGDAPAGRRGLHAQPRPDGRRLLPHQGPLRRLARRRLALLGPAHRRRDRQQRRQLAVGRRDRQRHPANRVLNPVRQAERFDPDGDLRAPLPAGAGVGARQGDLPPLADGRLRAARLPRADRRPRRGRRRAFRARREG